MPQPQRTPPGPEQESVWDYPRPPRVEAVRAQVEVIFGGNTIAITLDPLRVLETSHPPVYYLPPDSIVPGSLVPSGRTSWCEFKGLASYLTVILGRNRAPDAAWRYDDPSPGYEALAGYVAFYPGLMDVCLVDGEFVSPQPGRFYGGWVTSKVVGPFKGEPGTEGW
ncbi:MAG: DUF427 domain-containing protein [Actinomycetota bacterium]|nr:DUF427 domain-containing protein [Actinomycetota bacterium]PLS74880.1 MAG: hypothetical protein CYG61_10340 [Actinomycetota bacterium]